MSATAVRLLLVEDNPGDVDLTREHLDAAGIPNELYVASDGQQALDFLRDEASPKPQMILLDLNLPKVDGKSVLRVLKADARLRRIPVMVFSSSRAESDIHDSYDLGASCYVPKPVDLEGFEQVVRAVESFWLNVVSLPSLRHVT